ncbi:MAG: PspA/IM30 family protein [Dehalococcoidia bacterium]|nr:PspA/IM30 family protein [Dehalococcoidia bacterium]
MGLLSRMSTVIQAKMAALLERAEDPRETLDYSYQKQVEMLQNVKRGIVDVTTSKRRLELQAAKIQESGRNLDDQARRALAAGREDLARTALERKQVIASQLQSLTGQIEQLKTEQGKLEAAEQRLSTKVEAFRTRKETIKAQYSAAEAQVRIGEAVTGISEEMADVGLAVERAEDKTEQMRARAGAIDELLSTGVLEDLTGSSDAVESELAKISASQNVENELASLKALIKGPELKQLEGGK